MSYSLIVISVELLDDTRGVLDDLLVRIGRVLSERLNDAANAHVLERLAALSVHTKVANREESDAAR